MITQHDLYYHIRKVPHERTHESTTHLEELCSATCSSVKDMLVVVFVRKAKMPYSNLGTAFGRIDGSRRTRGNPRALVTRPGRRAGVNVSPFVYLFVLPAKLPANDVLRIWTERYVYDTYLH